MSKGRSTRLEGRGRRTNLLAEAVDDPGLVAVREKGVVSELSGRRKKREEEDERVMLEDVIRHGDESSLRARRFDFDLVVEILS